MKKKNLILSVIAILVFVKFSVAQTLPSYVPTNGLVSWWQFSGDATDGSGNGHHGIINSAILCPDRFNNISSAYYFNGNNQQIICSNDSLLTNHRNLTASSWFNVQNRYYGWQQNIIMANIGNFGVSGGFEIFTSNPPNANITGMFRIPSFQDMEINTLGLYNIDSSQWYHVVYSLEYFPGIDSTKASIYLNNSLIKVQYFRYGISYSNIIPFTIGANVDSITHQRNFYGKLDDIGLWNRVLSQSEITDLYNAVNVGVNETMTGMNIKIYPNPSTNQIIVQVEASEVGSTYEITDLLGKKVLTGKLESEKTKIEFEELSSGSYLLHTNNKSKQIFKIIKR